ncbi:hypothetical protein J6590_105048, partial [Homalodisca vitripennis]
MFGGKEVEYYNYPRCLAGEPGSPDMSSTHLVARQGWCSKGLLPGNMHPAKRMEGRLQPRYYGNNRCDSQSRHTHDRNVGEWSVLDPHVPSPHPQSRRGSRLPLTTCFYHRRPFLTKNPHLSDSDHSKGSLTILFNFTVSCPTTAKEWQSKTCVRVKAGKSVDDGRGGFRILSHQTEVSNIRTASPPLPPLFPLWYFPYFHH